MNDRKWIVLDRDGTLIADPGYLSDPGGVEIMPGVLVGLRSLSDAGYRFIVITNQSGIGRGYFTERDMRAVNSRTEKILKNAGIIIERSYHCPHTPDAGCHCRKPGIALVERAERELGFSRSEICCVIGDKRCDAELAHNLETRSIIIGGADERTDANNVIVADFLQAARVILDDGWKVCERQ